MRGWSLVVLLLHVLLCLINGAYSGRMSSYVRTELPSTDIPLESEWFAVPKGYNAPQQVHITQGDYDGKAVIISWVTVAEPGLSEVFYGKNERQYDQKAEGTITNYSFYDYKSGYIYHCLVDGLEASQKSKETWQLKLLLTYLQNGISEPWQRIPSVIAIFAAEASLTLLDSSHTQFTTISKFLMHSASANLQSIPLFPTLWSSSSVHFKADRLWMLQLLYAGSNLADDAKLYKRPKFSL